MEIKWGQLVGAATFGFLIGLAWCYWKAIKTVYENKDVITSGVDALSSAQTFYGNLRKL